ncbi:MAG: 2,3,4,5-tetrahydropyridine-2,6-dicarboxylate N-succinyltransferase [Ignavibacteria bacterium]|nr:2,3,4,5-tetrahydropyridine-2,6-dicarboxylate N-succinyltransferase [Ignavibacteria bacterium]
MVESLLSQLQQLKNQFDENLFLEFSKGFVDALNKGIIRAAEPSGSSSWLVNEWVKEGILLLFKYSRLYEFSNNLFSFIDKELLPVRQFSLGDRVRIVPGGTAVRSGAYIASDVIIMPPSYVNIGAYVDSGTLLDSHSLVGSCAQIGKRVHLSAGSQIGGVLEPVGARPVIVEDDVFIGGNCGIYEGVLVRRSAVIAAGVILTSSTKVYDLVNEKVYRAKNGLPLEIPENAVVVPGSKQIDSEFARLNGLSLYVPIIVKYRDERTDAKSTLEMALR